MRRLDLGLGILTTPSGVVVPYFPCPYLGGEVELTEERERHIAQSHPELTPALRDWLAQVLGDPDEVRPSSRARNARLFARWFDEVRGGKHVVVVIVSEGAPGGRHWIVTAYVARKPDGGHVEWMRT